MSLDFFMVMSNLISLFALIAVGYVAVRSGILKENASSYFSSLLMKITLPCTIFISLAQKEYDNTSLIEDGVIPPFIHDSLIIMAAGFVVFTAMLYLSRYIAGILGVNKSYRGVWAFASTFTNSGFMGFPICLALFGAEGLALSVMLNIVFNLTVFTLGAIEVSRDNPASDSGKIDMKSIIFSNINIAIVLSLIFYLGRIPLPSMIATPVTYLSGITTPLSMIIIGIALARETGAELFTSKDAWLSTLMSLIVYPVALCSLLRFMPLGDNPLIAAVLIIIVAMPSASITAAICDTYNGDMNFAAKVMFLQNLLCIFSIPLVCMILP